MTIRVQCKNSADVRRTAQDLDQAPSTSKAAVSLEALHEAVSLWIRTHESQIGLVSMGTSDVLPLKPGYNEPKLVTWILLKLTDPTNSSTLVAEKVFAVPLDGILMKSMTFSAGQWKQLHARGRRIPNVATTTLAIVGLFPSEDMPIGQPVLESIPIAQDGGIRDPALAKVLPADIDWVHLVNEHVEPGQRWSAMLRGLRRKHASPE